MTKFFATGTWSGLAQRFALFAAQESVPGRA